MKVSTASIAAGNDIAARIILADPAKYAGLALMWARLWMECHRKEMQ
jgi:hypothetical protein